MNRENKESSLRTVEVPERDWARTLNDFSATHEGWLISLDVLAPMLGVQPQIRELPLRGVTAETGPRGTAITISAARFDGEHITHLIPSPTYVRIERTNEGADVALEIESDEGLAQFYASRQRHRRTRRGCAPAEPMALVHDRSSDRERREGLID